MELKQGPADLVIPVFIPLNPLLKSLFVFIQSIERKLPFKFYFIILNLLDNKNFNKIIFSILTSICVMYNYYDTIF